MKTAKAKQQPVDDANPAQDFDLKALEALPEFDAAHYLQSEEAIAAYLNEFLDEPAMMAHALGVAAKARGMTEVAKKSGIARESLYKALRSTAAPRLDTIVKVMAAFGVRLVVEPIPATGGAIEANERPATKRGRQPAQVPRRRARAGAV